MPNDVANPFPGESILPMVQIGVHRSENDCWTCGTARRIVYSEPVARDYELQLLSAPPVRRLYAWCERGRRRKGAE